MGRGKNLSLVLGALAVTRVQGISFPREILFIVSLKICHFLKSTTLKVQQGLRNNFTLLLKRTIVTYYMNSHASFVVFSPESCYLQVSNDTSMNEIEAMKLD